MTNQQKKKQGIILTPKTLAILAVVVILLVAGGVTLGLNWQKWFGDTPVTDEFTPDIDPDAQDWNGGELPDQGGEEEVGIKIPGYPSITIPADTTRVAVPH